MGTGCCGLGEIATLSAMKTWATGLMVMGVLVPAASAREGSGGTLVGYRAFEYQPAPSVELVEPAGDAPGSRASTGAAGEGAGNDFQLDGSVPMYGSAGSRWWSIGTAVSYDFDDATGVNLNGSITYFLIEDVELTFELGAWYHSQPGDDAVGINPEVVFRWHALHDAEKDWTVFLDTGIGLLISTDLVPEDGTGVNFMPRVGAGFTVRLGESQNRLMAGVRWHHISNARFNGEARNPSRDGVAVHASVVFPF